MVANFIEVPDKLLSLCNSAAATPRFIE